MVIEYHSTLNDAFIHNLLQTKHQNTSHIKVYNIMYNRPGCSYSAEKVKCVCKHTKDRF